MKKVILFILFFWLIIPVWVVGFLLNSFMDFIDDFIEYLLRINH